MSVWRTANILWVGTGRQSEAFGFLLPGGGNVYMRKAGREFGKHASDDFYTPTANFTT